VYIHGKAQTPLGRFVVDVLYEQVATNTQEIELMELEPCIGSAVGDRNSGLSSTTLLISVNGKPWRNFSKSTVIHAKIGHVSQTTPLSGVICHVFGNT